MTKHVGFSLAWLAVVGCSKPEPVVDRRGEPDAASPTETPIQPKLDESKFEVPNIKFESEEAEIAYWQERTIAEMKRRFAKMSEAEIQKLFDDLSPDEQANVQRIRSWLPHKRILEMGNAAGDVATLTVSPVHFDTDLALKRLFEYSDESGARTLAKRLGITKPRTIVWFQWDFGQITPDVQSLIWGLNQKLRDGGVASLNPAERSLVQARPGLFPPY